MARFGPKLVGIEINSTSLDSPLMHGTTWFLSCFGLPETGRVGVEAVVIAAARAVTRAVVAGVAAAVVLAVSGEASAQVIGT